MYRLFVVKTTRRSVCSEGFIAALTGDQRRQDGALGQGRPGGPLGWRVGEMRRNMGRCYPAPGMIWEEVGVSF